MESNHYRDATKPKSNLKELSMNKKININYKKMRNTSIFGISHLGIVSENIAV